MQSGPRRSGRAWDVFVRDSSSASGLVTPGTGAGGQNVTVTRKPGNLQPRRQAGSQARLPATAPVTDPCGGGFAGDRP